MPTQALRLPEEHLGMIACFPTYARQLPGGERWQVNAAGMVVRPLPDSSRRRTVALAVLRRLLDLEPGRADDPILQARAGAFLFERVVGCRMNLQLGSQEIEAGATDRLGHFEASFELPHGLLESCMLDENMPGGWIRYRALVDREDAAARQLGIRTPPAATAADATHGHSAEDGCFQSGCVQCVGPVGLSVISDIDDTVKLTNVGDRRELLANTFLREFRPVPGMAELYRQWQDEGVAFHYVSASPWQLAGCLAGFFADFGLPTGSMHLTLFRLKDTTPLGRLPSKKRSKRRSIERILDDFPARRFILVGDSGEKDPEIYAAVARRRPHQVAAIAVREVVGHPRSDSLQSRLGRLSRLLPEGMIHRFTAPEDLESLMATVIS